MLAPSSPPVSEPVGKAHIGRVFWITGLSGAGKTTVGMELWRRLRTAGRSAVFLDGDALRTVIAEDLGHDTEGRRRSAMRNARLCELLAEQGDDVVCATISLFHEVQRWNRENIPGYREIYLRVPMDELRRRDSKGIYAAAERGDRPTSLALICRQSCPRGRIWSSTITGRSTSPPRSTASGRNASCVPERAHRRSLIHHEGGDTGSAGAATAQWACSAPGSLHG